MIRALLIGGFCLIVTAILKKIVDITRYDRSTKNIDVGGLPERGKSYSCIGEFQSEEPVKA